MLQITTVESALNLQATTPSTTTTSTTPTMLMMTESITGAPPKPQAQTSSAVPISGGNFWAYPNDTGYSQTCADSNSDGICDSPYALDSNNTDYLPLAYKQTNVEIDTIGIYRNGVFYLRNSNDAGIADLAFGYGAAGDTPVVGDWDGDGTDTVGVYRDGVFYLRNSNDAGIADLAFGYGISGDMPVVGDWNDDGTATIGVYRGDFYLRNSNDAGVADLAFGYGAASDTPVIGNWDGQ
jgi:hypothetical protein